MLSKMRRYLSSFLRSRSSTSLRWVPAFLFGIALALVILFFTANTCFRPFFRSAPMKHHRIFLKNYTTRRKMETATHFPGERCATGAEPLSPEKFSMCAGIRLSSCAIKVSARHDEFLIVLGDVPLDEVPA